MEDSITNLNGKKEPVKTPNIPRADADLRDTALKVCETWHNNPGLTLLWITPPNFKIIAEQYKETLGLRQSAGSARPQFTGKLGALDAKIDLGASRLKDYLAAKYGKKVAPDYYAAFGIVKVGKNYAIPADRNNRMSALELIIPALTVEGFEDMEFGHDFWTEVQTEYLDNLSKASDIDSSVSTKVGTKNELKKQIRKVLNALISLLRANYPDTYKNEMRNWGFQKEKY